MAKEFLGFFRRKARAEHDPFGTRPEPETLEEIKEEAEQDLHDDVKWEQAEQNFDRNVAVALDEMVSAKLIDERTMQRLREDATFVAFIQESKEFSKKEAIYKSTTTEGGDLDEEMRKDIIERTGLYAHDLRQAVTDTVEQMSNEGALTQYYQREQQPPVPEHAKYTPAEEVSNKPTLTDDLKFAYVEKLMDKASWLVQGAISKAHFEKNNDLLHQLQAVIREEIEADVANVAYAESTKHSVDARIDEFLRVFRNPDNNETQLELVKQMERAIQYKQKDKLAQLIYSYMTIGGHEGVKEELFKKRGGEILEALQDEKKIPWGRLERIIFDRRMDYSTAAEESKRT
ncbi:MAG: hypothetical protein ABIG66_00325 [Candidatus Kerfeldbacteria bacterium]